MAEINTLEGAASSSTVPSAASTEVRACSDAERARLVQLRTTYHQSINYVKPIDIKNGTADWWAHLDYLSKGAIEFPGNGDNVKLDNRRESCLSCIKYIRPCGSSVIGGKCNVCRGDVDGNVRVCRWLEPNKNVWTYPAHQHANKSTRIYWNTREGRAKKALLLASGLWSDERKDLGKIEADGEEDRDDEADRAELQESDYFGLLNSQSGDIMRSAAQQMLRKQLIKADATENLDSMFELTSASLASLRDQVEEAAEDEPAAVRDDRLWMILLLEPVVLHLSMMVGQGAAMPAEMLVSLATSDSESVGPK